MGVAHRAEIIVDHVVSVPVQGELRNGHKDVGCLLQRMLICAHCCLNLTDTQFGGTSTKRYTGRLRIRSSEMLNRRLGSLEPLLKSKGYHSLVLGSSEYNIVISVDLLYVCIVLYLGYIASDLSLEPSS